MPFQLVNTGRRTSDLVGTTVPPVEPGVLPVEPEPVEPFPPLEPGPGVPPV